MSEHQAVKPHIVPLGTYLSVASALFVLTVITVMVAQVDLGGWNVVVALFVAGCKATLVALFFMHLLYDKKIYLVILLVSVLFLMIFMSFTMFDTMTRDQIYEIRSGQINKKAIIYGQGEMIMATDSTVADSTLMPDSASAEEIPKPTDH